MEDFYSSDPQLLTAIGGVEVTPFPGPPAEPSAGLPTTAVASPAPPQKLRPIRNAGGSIESQPSDGDSPPELGFQPLDLPQILPEELDLEEDRSSAMALLKFKSQIDASFISSINSQISQFPMCFSSSSDDSAENPDQPESSEKPRRSRKRKKQLESFLQDLMGRVIEKQEQMHQQLMEMMQTKEKERILREEAWRKQEMERAQKEQEFRSQEAARNLALLSFIQSALGQDVQLPPPTVSLQLPSPGEENGENDPDPSNKRWPTSEVQALITLRAALDHKFRAAGPKGPVWEQVSAGMANMGYSRDGKKCREKWESINKYFRKATSGNGKKRSENAKSCPYFNELETLYRNQLITTCGKAGSPSGDGNIEQEEARL